MRIQHNISALNSYNKLSGNNNKLSKNLEKLSSGYAINRAADNAAGLAISEKMRAQITGLETCQQNSKDGISLVQTAEGALTEVHSMLNRMVALTTQASNGIYTDQERTKIQDELDQLNEEIDRIADATNFNGIKLLDGSLAAGAAGGSGAAADADSTAVISETASDNIKANITNAAATKGEYSVTTAAGNYTAALDGNGAKASVTFNLEGIEGKSQVTIDIKVNDDGNLEINGEDSGVAYAAGTIHTDLDDLLVKALNKELKGSMTVAVDGTTAGKLVFTADEAGSGKAAVTSMTVSGTKKDGKTEAAAQTVAAAKTASTGTDNTDSLTFANMKVYDKAGADTIEDCIMEIGGEKFLLVKNDTEQKTIDGLDSDINVVTVTATTLVAADKQAVLNEMQHVLKDKGINVGFTPQAGGAASTNTTATSLDFTGSTSATTAAGGGLRLQIGETNDSFNMLDVNVKDCHADAIGVGLTTMRVDDVDTANKAMMAAKDAVEYVSAVRSKLGAIQNRLDHTLNNLEETTTNLTDAESRIRDTDMAQEMMKYTKNNILIQSSQAMLAQANQVPQGVLQLLQ